MPLESMDAPARALARTAALDLEDLLAEIRARAEGAQKSRDRLAGLLQAVVAVSSELDLAAVLTRIVDSACALLDASYGALGVLDDSGRHLLEFITHGVPPGSVEGEPPTGHGVLGLLLSDPRPHRIDDVPAHPASLTELPPGHPPVDTFVGAPIRVRGELFGNLYLTQKRGGGAFSAEDEELIVALAAAAGIAIENAQLYRRARRKRDWAMAVGELTRTLLEGRNEKAALARMVKRARDLGCAQLAIFAVPEPDGDGLLVHIADSDPSASGDVAGAPLISPRWRQVLANRSPLLLFIEAGDTHVGELSADLRRRAGLPAAGATAVLPLVVGDEQLGLLALCWPEEDLGEAVAAMEALPNFTEQMSLALLAARAQRSRSRNEVLEDRDRIARDMHDHVIQRLYATGLSLQSAARGAEGKTLEKIAAAVDELDRAVKDIRHTIFELHHPISEGGLGPELEAIVASCSRGFDFVPDVLLEGLSDIPMAYEPDVLAVVREGLSNISRHAGATDAQVTVSALDAIEVVIRDNGVGMTADQARSGLVNLRERAAVHGGSFQVQPGEGGGTELVWRVPLPDR